MNTIMKKAYTDAEDGFRQAIKDVPKACVFPHTSSFIPDMLCTRISWDLVGMHVSWLAEIHRSDQRAAESHHYRGSGCPSRSRRSRCVADIPRLAIPLIRGLLVPKHTKAVTDSHVKDFAATKVAQAAANPMFHVSAMI